MLELAGVPFGSIFCATGARGFYGEGYPFHKYWKRAGMMWDGTSFSGKTLTLLPRKGNMPLKEDGVTPIELVPKCIWASFRNDGEMLNAVGLSNKGAKFYLSTGNYHKLDKPFFISFMCLAEDAAGREEELRDFCMMLRSYMPFKTSVALQMNFGCPNSGHNLTEFYSEICKLLEIAKSLLGIPVVANTNALMPTSVLLEVSRMADALWIGNTIPFREPSTIGRIDWSRFGSVSPIRRRGIEGDGGLSSPACLPFTLEKIQELRDSGVHIPIVGGNGIRTVEDISDLDRVGADAVFIGSIAVVRPHRMKEIIDWARFTFLNTISHTR